MFVRPVNMLVIVIINVKNKEIKNCSITKKKVYIEIHLSGFCGTKFHLLKNYDVTVHE